jgi:hypothetical protein
MLFTAFDRPNVSEDFWRENSNFFPPKVFLKNAKAYILDHVEACLFDHVEACLLNHVKARLSDHSS